MKKQKKIRSLQHQLTFTFIGLVLFSIVTIFVINGVFLEKYYVSKKTETLLQAKEVLESIDVDGLLTPAAVEEYLTGSRKTAFPMQIYTERADRFAWGLMAGRVGVLVDGLPLGYLLPCTLKDLMQSPEDRGSNYVAAGAIRFLRYLSLLAALLLPGIFTAICLYHQEMIPSSWLKAIVESRDAVPFR